MLVDLDGRIPFGKRKRCHGLIGRRERRDLVPFFSHEHNELNVMGIHHRVLDFAHLHRKSGSLARFADFACDLRRIVARQHPIAMIEHEAVEAIAAHARALAADGRRTDGGRTGGRVDGARGGITRAAAPPGPPPRDILGGRADVAPQSGIRASVK